MNRRPSARPPQPQPHPTARRVAGWAGWYGRAYERLPFVYLVWAILVGTVIAWVVPPWQNPDEGAHVARAAQIGVGGLFGRRLGHNAGGLTEVAVDASIWKWAAADVRTDHRVTAAMLQAASVVGWGYAVRAFDNTATYPPFLYAAAVPALWAGHWLALPITLTLRWVRMSDAVAAACLGALALATARRLRIVLAAVLAMPMSIALAASASQDALMIPLAAWAVAAIDRERNGAVPPAGRRRQFAIAAALLAVMLARPPYLPLAALLLLLPAAGGSLRGRLAVGMAAGTVLWLGFVMWRISVPMNVADPPRQLALLLHHPVAFFAAVIVTLQEQGERFAAGMVGILGRLDTPLPDDFVHAGESVLVLALLSAAAPDAAGSRWWQNRTVLGVPATLASALAVFASIYIIWSAPGAATISGIQGRYFLPLLPALALTMPNLGRWTALLRPPALLAVLLLGAVGPAVSIATLIDRYYLVP